MTTDDGMNENNRIKEKLRKFHCKIVKSIDPGHDIADTLFADGVITIQQLKDINSSDNDRKRAEQLLFILHETHHPLACVSFRNALSVIPEYNWILERIDEKPANDDVEGMFH